MTIWFTSVWGQPVVNGSRTNQADVGCQVYWSMNLTDGRVITRTGPFLSFAGLAPGHYTWNGPTADPEWGVFPEGDVTYFYFFDINRFTGELSTFAC